MPTDVAVPAQGEGGGWGLGLGVGIGVRGWGWGLGVRGSVRAVCGGTDEVCHAARGREDAECLRQAEGGGEGGEVGGTALRPTQLC